MLRSAGALGIVLAVVLVVLSVGTVLTLAPTGASVGGPIGDLFQRIPAIYSWLAVGLIVFAIAGFLIGMVSLIRNR